MKRFSIVALFLVAGYAVARVIAPSSSSDSIGSSAFPWPSGHFSSLSVNGFLVPTSSCVATSTYAITAGYAETARYASNAFYPKYYIVLSSTTDLAVASTTGEYPVVYTDVELSNGLTWSTSAPSRVYSTVTGKTYLVSFSAIASCSSPNKSLDIWAKINGTNVPRSNTRLAIPTASNLMCMVTTFLFADTVPGSYFELWYWSDSTGTKIEHLDAGSSPERPVMPAIITSITSID